MSTVLRLVASAAIAGGAYAYERVATAAGAVASGQIAVSQLQDSDFAPIQTNLAAHYLNGSSGIVFALFVLALALIWAGPLKRALTNRALAVTAIGFLCLGALQEPAKAYYDTKDYPEYIEILPNQTAFLIPETGANKAGQASFMSEQYLVENKVAMKRIQIPHTLIRNPGWTYDYFVPAARLLVVDRSPVSREWVTSNTRGTSVKDQGVRFETADSINIRTGVVISAFVKEEDAAKFVYWFGAKSQSGNPTDPAVNFASVIYGKSLAEVVDENVHRTVQAVMAKEFGRRSTDMALKEKAQVMDAVEEAVKKQYAPMGITVTTLGYAEGLSFEDDEIQAAINQTYIADKKAQSATAQLATLPIQKQLLDMEIERQNAKARQTLAERWNGSAAGVVPNWVVIPSDVFGWMKGWFGYGDRAPVDPPRVAAK